MLCSLTSTNTSDNLDQQQQIGSGTLLQKNEPMTDSSDTTEEVLSEKASNTSCPESFPEVYIITSNDENKYTAKSSPLENNTSMVELVDILLLYAIHYRAWDLAVALLALG